MSNIVTLKTSANTQEVVRSITTDNVYEVTRFVSECIRGSGIQYKTIAIKANCCTQTVSRLADGTTKDPRIGTVIRILFAIGGKATFSI